MYFKTWNANACILGKQGKPRQGMVGNMAIGVVEFSREGYKIKNVFA